MLSLQKTVDTIRARQRSNPRSLLLLLLNPFAFIPARSVQPSSTPPPPHSLPHPPPPHSAFPSCYLSAPPPPLRPPHTHLLGLVVKASASRAEDLGLIPAFGVDRARGRVIPETKTIGTPVATLPGARRCKVNAETVWPSIL